jgi:ATP-dependent DNA helicase PIF1
MSAQLAAAAAAAATLGPATHIWMKRKAPSPSTAIGDPRTTAAAAPAHATQYMERPSKAARTNIAHTSAPTVAAAAAVVVSKDAKPFDKKKEIVAASSPAYTKLVVPPRQSAERRANAVKWLAAKHRHMEASVFSALSDEQLAVLVSIVCGKTVFFSGSAGTGKSHLMRGLKQMLSSSTTAFTAYTGLASQQFECGTTLSKWGGVGIATGSQQEIWGKVRLNKKALERWRNTQVLVIDEVSMVGAELFDALDYVGRRARKDQSKPWGGIQLVLCGDLLQLPAINARPIFHAKSWIESVDIFLMLTEVFRQKGDPKLADVLNDIRMGQLDLAGEELVRSLAFTKLDSSDGVDPVHIYPLKVTVAGRNEERLAQLKGQRFVFQASDYAKTPHDLEAMEKNCGAPSRLELKVGAQVILVWNLCTEEGFSNGTVGVVESIAVDLKTGALTPKVKFGNKVVPIVAQKFETIVNKQVVSSRTQIPLILGWAITVHKSQGMTIPKVVLDVSRTFECGQLYVGMSRVPHRKGLLLTGFRREHIKADPEVVQWYMDLAESTTTNVKLIFDELAI